MRLEGHCYCRMRVLAAPWRPCRTVAGCPKSRRLLGCYYYWQQRQRHGYRHYLFHLVGASFCYSLSMAVGSGAIGANGAIGNGYELVPLAQMPRICGPRRSWSGPRTKLIPPRHHTKQDEQRTTSLAVACYCSESNPPPHRTCVWPTSQ